VSRIARAQAYPSRPVRIIVGFPAGGATDIQARLMGQWLSDRLGQQFIVENRSGASGNIGTEAVAKAPADGYTLLQVVTPNAINAALYSNLNFDFARDITPVICAARLAYVVVVNPSVPVTTIPELIAHAKANPGKINYGTPGAGTSLHITMEQIARLQGLKWTHVPFKGNAEATSALLGGHIHVEADSTGWAQLVNTGELRLLVTWGATRTRNWPSVPTLKESGLDIVSTSPFGIAGPAGMDRAVVAALHDAFKKGMEEPSYIATMEKFDQEPSYLNSDDYRAYALRQSAEEKRLIAELGLKEE
jgi:tripartite-type tricarboxylate transporter receptor subunit TctC